MKKAIVIGNISNELKQYLDIVISLPEPTFIDGDLYSQIEYIIERIIRKYGKDIYFYFNCSPIIYMNFRKILKKRKLKILYPVFNKTGFINFSII